MEFKFNSIILEILPKFSKERDYIYVITVFFSIEKGKKNIHIILNFSDTFSIIGTPTAHRALIDLILSRIKKLDTKLDAIVGLEARGFVFGPQIALELQIPFIPVRKPGKLPGKVIKIDYDLEYGTKHFFFV